MRINEGDTVVVRKKHYGWEPYSVGDVFTVRSVEPDETSNEGWDVLLMEGYGIDYMMFAAEVERVEADAKAGAKADGDISAASLSAQAAANGAPQDYVTALASIENDTVSHPSHYTQGRFEVIEIIEQTAGGYSDGFTAHCVGTATKYLNRAPFKHESPLEDLRKAAKYIEFAIEHEEKKAK